MSAIRFRPNNVCAATLGDIPGGTAYIKKNPKSGGPRSAFPVAWLGFICKTGARRLSYSRPGKLVASSVTNGDIVGHTWRDLGKSEYVLCMLVQVGDAHEFGAFGVVDRDGWPIVRSDTGPRLTVVTQSFGSKVATFGRR